MSLMPPHRSLTRSSTLQARTTTDGAVTGRPKPTAPMPKFGEVLGKYRLTGLLGEGSTSRVYRGEHVRLPLAVAVKVFGPAEWQDAAALHRIRQEATLLCGLNHPNIIRLWDFDDEGPHPYLVTELVDGRPLSRMVGAGRPLIPDWAVHLALQVVDGLEAALELGIVHRDVKPSNILLTRDGRAKIADLGLAVIAGPVRAPGPAPEAEGIPGTAAYVAPEQARNTGPVDHRADIYSLGATLYHCVCGRLPFTGRSVMEVIFKHLQQPPPPPSDVAPQVPRRLSDLVLRMMAKSPSDRFATYDDLRREMLAVLEEN
jgi:serine/threonine protein kinase